MLGVDWSVIQLLAREQRSNETMHTAGKKEIDVLTKLGDEDPDGKKHICKLLSHFEYKGHLCMVFTPMDMNLRKLLKTYGREVGITLTAIRMYARQMFIGLLHMVKCNVLHGDIKLDNILISKDLKTVQICDFGTADWSHEAVITPYMVSRYYRPPEICLGLKYSFAMDLWSVGVCLFELYTGKFMFTGRNNNEMLKQFMVSACNLFIYLVIHSFLCMVSVSPCLLRRVEVESESDEQCNHQDYKGLPSKKLLKRCQFFDQHFEEDKADIVFKYLTKDVCTKQEIIQKIRYDKPSKSIYESLLKHKAEGDDVKKVSAFVCGVWR
jgi:serine/threonine protein kinase